MTIIFGDSATFTGQALPKEDHTFHESINVDNGAVHIDPDHSTHVIRIEHDKGDGKDILRAVDNATGTNTARIDSDGIAVLHDVYYHSTATGGTSTLDDLDTSVENNALVLANASAIDTGTVDNLVKRSQANGTEVDNLHVVARTSGYTASYPPAGLYFNQGTCDDSLDLLGLGQLSFQPYDGSGNAITSRSFSFGRAMPLSGQTRAQADPRRDGLLIEDDAVNHSTEIMCSNELPTIRLVGTKATTTSNGYTEPVCPVIDVQDGTGTTRFAVFDDGFVVQKGHQDTDPDALNSGHFGSVIAGDNSVYVGSSRLSYDRTAHKLTLHTLKHQIPTFLQSAGLPSASVPLALDAMTVHGWVALARTYLNNSRLQVSDVFPFANSGDWNAGGFADLSGLTVDGLETTTSAVFDCDTTVNSGKHLNIGGTLDILESGTNANMHYSGGGALQIGYAMSGTGKVVLGTSGQDLELHGNLTHNGSAFTGITSAQAAAIVANTAKTGITTTQADAITANTAKTGITSGQAAAIVANTAKIGITSAQAAEITANTAKTGITSGQAAAIVANTAKTGITSGQADAIVANTAKTGITSGQAAAIVANTAKTGITTTQADAITANTAKYTTTQVDTALAGKQDTIGAGDLQIAYTSGLQAALDAKEDTINLTAERAVVSGPTGALRAMSVTSTQVGYLLNVTSDLQAQLDAKQAALTRTNIGTVTWSSGPQTTTIANVTAKQGYFVVVPTLNQPSITAANRTLEVTIEIASLAETDMVIVPDSQMSNHSGGAINISHARPNSDLGTIRIKLRSAANVDYTGNTTDKFYVSYLVL